MPLIILLARYRAPRLISLLPGAIYYYISPLLGATYYVARYRVPPIISPLPGATYYYVSPLPGASSS